MRFGTWVLPMVGLLAALDRSAATATTADRCGGHQRRGGSPVVLTVVELPGILWKG
jgi:hypothetical protein